MNRRPPVSYRSGHFQPIHGAGHVDIGKNEVDILTDFENGYRLVGIFRNDDGASGVFEFFRDEFPDQGLIFHNQDCRHFHSSGGHFQATTARIKHGAEQSFFFDASKVRRRSKSALQTGTHKRVRI